MQAHHRNVSPETFEEEEWDRVRMGYLSEADGRVWEDAFHPPRRTKRPRYTGNRSSSWRRALMEHRAAYLANEKLYYRSRREVIVKAVSRAKTPHTIKNMLGYVLRSREGIEGPEIPALHNEFGTPCADQPVPQLLKEWNLPDDTGASSSDLEADKPIGPDAQSKRSCVLAHHLVVSIDRRRDDPPALLEHLEAAMHSAVDELFTQFGYRVYWALHNDKPLHPHFHIILRAQSDDGRRLRFDKNGDYLHFLRIKFAEHLGRQGIACQATRRMDRIEDRLGMIRGDLPLKSGYADASNTNWTSRLRERAPNWWSLVQKQQKAVLAEEKRHELFGHPERFPEIWAIPERFRNGLRLKRAESKSIWPVRLLLKDAKQVYADPLSAVHSLIQLGVDGDDNTALASWLVKNAPSQFGKVKDDGQGKSLALAKLSREVNVLRNYFRSHHLRDQPKPTELDDIRWAERNIERVDFQRRSIAAEVLRVAAFCRDELDDTRRAFQIRWELTHSFLVSGAARRSIKSVPKQKSLLCIESTWIGQAPLMVSLIEEEKVGHGNTGVIVPRNAARRQSGRRQPNEFGWSR